MGIERSHNQMHNNLLFSMSDAQFSITNLLFHIYHSWIDVQLEMKIRLDDDYNVARDMHS